MGNFRKLRVWEDGIELAEYIYKVTKRPEFDKDYGLKNQIQRAVVSISSNLAEGEERQTNKEAVYYFNVRFVFFSAPAEGNLCRTHAILRISAPAERYLPKIAFRWNAGTFSLPSSTKI